MGRFLVVLFIFALAVYAVSDVIASSDQRRGRTPKFMWILITLLIPVLGPIIWIVFSGYNKGATRTAGGAATPPPYKPRQRPSTARTGSVAPDDDPAFLWKLEAEQRRRANEERRKAEDLGKSGDSDSKDATDEDGTQDSDPSTKP